MKEFCIMPASSLYSNVRLNGYHRHEIFFGKNRKKSIKYGLVVFLPPELHNASNAGVHFNHEFDMELKQAGQRVAMQYYGWDIDQFREVFGKNYL